MKISNFIFTPYTNMNFIPEKSFSIFADLKNKFFIFKARFNSF